MTINNFYHNLEIQEQPLDLRTTIPRNNTRAIGLRETGRILAEAMGVLIDSYNEEMDISASAVPVNTNVSDLSWIFQGTLPGNNNPELQKNARVLELRKQTIGCEQRDAEGNIVSLDFSKRFVHKRLLLEEILQHLEEIFGEKNIYHTVKRIRVRDNRLNRLPRGIIKFTHVKSIDLNNNRFTTIPSEIYTFKKLKKLSIKNNFIRYISSQIGHLKHLEEIDISRNRIEHLHTSFSTLKRLQTINLSNNLLRDIPKWFSKFHNVECLNVSSNNLFMIPSEIFGKNLEYLDASNNHIETIPKAIENSSNLLDINFDSNEIVNIPDEIGNLAHLRNVYFNDNPTLRGFSNNLYRLPRVCTVGIDNSRIAFTTLSEIQSKTTEVGYHGPAFEFFMPAAGERLRESLMESLYTHTSRNPPRIFKNLLSLSDHLEMWLDRLDWMSDFQNVSESLPLRESIIDCIEYAEVNSEYYKLFESLIQGATATCGDGVALSIIDLGIAKEVLTFMETNQIVEMSRFLLDTVFPRQILQKIAGQKITFLKLEAKQREKQKKGNTRLIDDVEIYLAYPLLLKKRLHLSITINTMVAREASTRVTQEDLEVAALEVEKQRADKRACAEFLVNNTYWIELIKKLYPQEYEVIHTQSIEMMDESELVAEEYRRNSLIALSGINL